MKIKYDKILGRLREKDTTTILNPSAEAVTEVIYDENNEWQTAKSETPVIKIDFDSLLSPAHGTKHIALKLNAGFLLNSVSAPINHNAVLFETVESFVPDANHSAIGIFPDKNSDTTVDNIRIIIWYEALPADVSFYAISKVDGTRFELVCPFINHLALNFPEIDFSSLGLESFILNAGEIPLPEAGYDIYINISGTKHTETYQMVAVDDAITGGGSLSFTRSAAIEATGAKISLSIKNPVVWLPATALSIDLYNDSIKVGELVINASNLHGFDPANVTTYQRIDLPVADFNFFGSLITKVVVQPSGSWPVGLFLFDWIVLTSASLSDNFQSIIDQINQNIINAGDLITNELKSYIGDLIENLTITWEQITGSPILNQDFVDYIQNLIDNLTIKWEQIIGSPVLNQTLIDLLNQYKTDIQNSFADFIVGDTVTNVLQQYIDNLLTEIRNQLQEITNATTINETLLTEIQEQITAIDQTIQYITEGDTITQEYKDYIEQKFITLQETITNITEGAVITEEISQYIDDSLTELTTLLQQYIDQSVGDSVTEIINQITENTTIKGEATRLISGTITWIENLDFLVSPLVYQILNRTYRTGIENLITIPANAENNPRFAVIYADIFGNVGYILGEAAAAPVVPHVNDTTQIALWTVYIPALGTEPAPDPDGETDEIVTVVVYDENIEWITGKTEEPGITIDFDSLTNPSHGLKHVAMTVVPSGEPGGFENLGLQSNTYPAPYFASLGIFGGGNTFGLSLAILFPDNNSDTTVDNIRTLTWYKINKQDISGYAISKATGERFNLSCSQVQTVEIDKPEIDFNVTTANGLILKAYQALANGNYDIYLDITCTRFVQKYNLSLVTSSLAPAAAQMSFTAPAPTAIEGGTLNLSLRTSAAWLSNTGLILELYNAAAKVGSLALLPGSFYGFNPANLEYQRLVIPLADFAPTAAEITALVIRPVNEWPGSVLDIDYITIQTGLQVDEGTAKQIETQSFEYRDVTEAGQRYTLDLSAYFGYKVLGVTLRANADTITTKVLINETPIVGLNPNIATSVKQFFAATIANNVAIGDELTLEIEGLTGNASAIVGSIKYVRV